MGECGGEEGRKERVYGCWRGEDRERYGQRYGQEKGVKNREETNSTAHNITSQHT